MDIDALLKKINLGVDDANQANELLAECYNAIDALSNKRTEKQSSSRWVYLDQMARAFNEAGIDRQKLIERIKATAKVDAQNTRETMYWDYWKPVHDALYPEVKRLNTEQIQKVYEAMNNHSAKAFGISKPWPDRFNMGQ